MVQLDVLQLDLPDIYKTYKEFINANVFGEGREETADQNEKAQDEYMEKFRTDVKAEKERRRKGKARAEQETSPSNSANGSEQE